MGPLLARTEIRELRSRTNDPKQYGRFLIFEVHGLKKYQNEDLLLELNEIGQSLVFKAINKQDVCDLQRFPSKFDKIPTVIVRTVSRTSREEWLAKRRMLLRRRKSGVDIQENITENRSVLVG